MSAVNHSLLPFQSERDRFVLVCSSSCSAADASALLLFMFTSQHVPSIYHTSSTIFSLWKVPEYILGITQGQSRGPCHLKRIIALGASQSTLSMLNQFLLVR